MQDCAHRQAARLSLVVDNGRAIASNSDSESAKPGRALSSLSSSTVHSREMPPRCRHFLTVAGCSPRATASSRTSDQLSMGMDNGDIMSRPSSGDFAGPKRLSKKRARKRQSGMVANVTEREYKAVIRLRTKEARKASGFTQERMAQLLKVDIDTYKKWENRQNSVIRIDKVADFCDIVRIDPIGFIANPTRDDLAKIRPAPKRRQAA